jgi:hypothetical protein
VVAPSPLTMRIAATRTFALSFEFQFEFLYRFQLLTVGSWFIIHIIIILLEGLMK